MARPPHTRSPSPTGIRRDNQANRRDRRNQSPDRDRDKRYRGRDERRPRDRSADRRDSYYRPGDRRDRSRDRRRSRSPFGRDRRNRSRDRDYRDRDRRSDYRDRRDDSRDRARRRDEPDRRRRDSRERTQRESSVKTSDSPATPSTPKAADEDRKKAERLAKLEAWKAKQAAEKERKAKEAAASGGARAVLAEMDKKVIESPKTSSPKSPAVDATDAALQEPPKPYAGKFDPKAIAQKAHGTKHGPTALGTDITLPVSQAGVKRGFNAGPKAPLSTSDQASKAGALRPLKKGGNLSGFGISSKMAAESAGQKRALDLEEEESTRKKFEKLPSPPLEDEIRDDTAQANGADEEDDDDGDFIAEGGTEEEVAAAARAAAAQREERLQAQIAADNAANGDTRMVDAPTTTQTETSMEVDEDIDPLDAFMESMGDPMANAPKKPKTMAKQPKQQEPEALFSDDENELEAVGTTQEDILAIASKKKKRDIPTVNHAKMNYESFRKNFFTEPIENTEMTEEDVANLRFELDGIKVRGVDVPKPVLKWAQCGLGVQTLEVIRQLKYEAPTSIQAQAIPAIMSGRDVIGVAKTGSGKTIAFLLPMFRHIKDQRKLESMEGPIGLIMSPTRELATQIHRECKPFLKALNLRAVCAYGGAPIKDQIAELKRGAEIVVCTPGRIIDLLAANAGRVTNLRRVTYIVLDEADRMFDMGFEPQVMKILANIRPGRQTVLFSATFPRNMEALARKTLTKPVEIVVGGRSVVAPEIKQIIEVRPENTKFLRTLELLGELFDSDDDARVLIFVDRQESADGLLNELMKKAYPCNSIHGGKDQLDRNEVINDFKAGVIPIMIATSVAARGLDVKQLKLVINYDTPNHLEDYVHRAGRTGRAGNTGTCVTFITEEQDRYAVDLAKALKMSGQEVPEALQKLSSGFLEKVKAGKEKASGTGFGGKGLDKFDAQREAKLKAERGMHKDQLGEDIDDDDKKDDKRKDELEPPVIKSSNAPPSAAPVAAPSVAPGGIDLTANIVIHKRETPAPSANGNNQMDKVRQAVEAISGRLNLPNTTRPGHPIDNKGPDAGAYHTTLEINDFPQKARWAVTNRTNVAKILDATGTSITTKGNFYAQGKTPGAGEPPKLYILIEGDTELVVAQAVRELQRLLVEGTTAAVNSEARAPVSGRYSVV